MEVATGENSFKNVDSEKREQSERWNQENIHALSGGQASGGDFKLQLMKEKGRESVGR